MLFRSAERAFALQEGAEMLVVATQNMTVRAGISSVLNALKQENILHQPVWYKNPDGTLNITKLLHAWTEFYREHSAIWQEKFSYKESAPHLLMLAFLQRIINGGETNYITATLAIYLDLYNIFVNLLSLLGILGGERD